MVDTPVPLGRRLLGAFAFAAIVVGLSARSAADDGRVSIDATKAGEPIAPFVYDQFIEHLGRCIYDGLWAEMLEDRKFYYPVTGEAPPWRRPSRRSISAKATPWPPSRGKPTGTSSSTTARSCTP